jgi:hypothetical protein
MQLNIHGSTLRYMMRNVDMMCTFPSFPTGSWDGCCRRFITERLCAAELAGLLVADFYFKAYYGEVGLFIS